MVSAGLLKVIILRRRDYCTHLLRQTFRGQKESEVLPASSTWFRGFELRFVGFSIQGF